jgi:hypothetical protein
MDPRAADAFGLEINIQLGLGIAAWNRIRVATYEPFPDDLAGRWNRIMGFVQDFQLLFSAAGILSDFFFPQEGRGDDPERVQALRAEYEVGPTSPLADRGVRNSWIHSGARLDRMLRASLGTGQSLGAFTLGPLGGERKKEGSWTRLRQYDTKANEFRVWDETLKLEPLLLEFQRLAPLAAKHEPVIHGANIPSRRAPD